MGGAKTENLLMVPSMLCLFPVFCLLLLASLSRTHQRVIITSYPPYHCRLRVRLSLPQKPYLGYNAQAQAQAQEGR